MWVEDSEVLKAFLVEVDDSVFRVEDGVGDGLDLLVDVFVELVVPSSSEASPSSLSVLTPQSPNAEMQPSPISNQQFTLVVDRLTYHNVCRNSHNIHTTSNKSRIQPQHKCIRWCLHSCHQEKPLSLLLLVSEECNRRILFDSQNRSVRCSSRKSSIASSSCRKCWRDKYFEMLETVQLSKSVT